jgi:hypothetical protein
MAEGVAAVSPPPGGLGFDQGVEKQASSRQPRQHQLKAQGSKFKGKIPSAQLSTSSFQLPDVSICKSRTTPDHGLEAQFFNTLIAAP